MTFKELILNSKYKDKINCLLPVLENAGIDNWNKLQNLPGIVGNFCNVDVYQFVREMNELIILNEIENQIQEEEEE